jgi:flavin reductase (DIM6/NTAB) family NADH-FMN oxidoreductase RutF
MKKNLGTAFRPVNPSPAALITSVDEQGRPNIITLGEVFNVSIFKPVIVGISIRSATYSHALIRTSGEFVINLTTAGLVEKVDRCGRVSGREGVDKFKQFGLTPVAASIVTPPLIEECPVNIECRVIEMRTVGDHDLVLGEVATVHADEEVLDEKGGIDPGRIEFLIHLNGGYWTLGPKIGPLGLSAAGPAG